jgi:ankyrin repeat protein
MVFSTHLFLIATLLAADDYRLVDAVKSKNKDAVQALLKQRVNVNAPQGDGSTALHWAAYGNDLDTTNLLIGAGANVNATTDLGVTPLYLAADIGSAPMVEKLLAAGANPSAAAWTGVSPLMLAARAGSVDAVRALLGRGVAVNAKEKARGQTALMWAVAHRHSQVVRLLAEKADIHARSNTGSLLVNKGGRDSEAVGMVETGGSTALLFAARQGDIECARVLLDFGANVNDVAADGNSALVIAAHSGHGGFAAFLLDRGANPNAAGAGYSILHAAVQRGDLELVKASLAHGANPNLPMRNGTPYRRGGADFYLPATLAGATPLLLAANNVEPGIVRVLAAAGADPRLAANNGAKALTVAVQPVRRGRPVLRGEDNAVVRVGDESQRSEVVRALLDLGADINEANPDGNTALHLAVTQRSDTIVQVLAERGARLDVKNGRGQTPLGIALGDRRSVGGESQVNSTADLLVKLGAKE